MSTADTLNPLRDIAPVTPFTLKPARVHEACGPAQVSFALYQMALHAGPVFWIAPAAQPMRLMPDRLPDGLAAQLIYIIANAEDDVLWATEETLRAEPTALVVAMADKPLSLTMGRRLQLAAEAGKTTGLLLIREGQGSNAAETRWHCDTRPAGEDSTALHWQITKNKSGTIGAWSIDWDGKTSACHMVDAICE